MFNIAQPIIKILRDYKARHNEEAVSLIVEQYRQKKLNYYPMIDYEGGLVKMFRYCTAPNICDPGKAKELASYLKKEYIVAYYAEKGVLLLTTPNTSLHLDIRKIFTKSNPGSIE